MATPVKQSTGFSVVLEAGFLPALCICSAALAGEITATGPEPDTLERQLELGRHEQLVVRKAVHGTTLAAFTTDGCSGGLSVGWQYLAARFPDFRARHGERPPWESCCSEHDRHYHAGGGSGSNALESFAARKAADLELKSCVLNIGEARAPELSADFGVSPAEVGMLYATIADLMYRAVRLGGLPCTGLPWRWGYGWPECR